MTFCPKQFTPGNYQADTHTAGSVSLLLQICLPCLLFGSGECEVTFKGGTNAANAPQIDYFLHVFAPIVRHFGIEFDLKLQRRGFYPKGGGCVILKTRPLKYLKPISFLEQGEVNHIRILSFAAGKVPEHVPQRMAKAARNRLNIHFSPEKTEYVIDAVKEKNDTAFGNGTGILVVAKTSTGCIFGGSALGEIGKKAETVGEEAANELIRNIQLGGCLDEYAQDQIIIFMALAKGKSKVRIGPLTLHTQTSIHYTQLLTGAKFTTTPIPPNEHKWKNKEQSLWLECEGIGFENEFLP
jgi:RNA 3'-terminal phosphate cyclase (ATP)